MCNAQGKDELCPAPAQGCKENTMANEKILVVDDDQNICELLRLYLTKEEIGRASCRERV